MNFCKLVFLYLPKTRKEAKALGLKLYYTGKMCRRGHICNRLTSTSKCRTCNKIWAKAKRMTDPEYRKKQNESCRLKNKKRYAEDAEYRAYQASFNASRNEKQKMRFSVDQEYREKVLRSSRKSKTKAKSINPDAFKDHGRRRYQKVISDPDLRCREAWRTLLKRSMRAGWVKHHSTEKELKYSPSDLKRHLESMFDSNMTWENYGKYWSIDHVRPVSSFPVDTHPSIVHALENLQPMNHIENIKKGAKWEG